MKPDAARTPRPGAALAATSEVMEVLSTVTVPVAVETESRNWSQVTLPSTPGTSCATHSPPVLAVVVALMSSTNVLSVFVDGNVMAVLTGVASGEALQYRNCNPLGPLVR